MPGIDFAVVRSRISLAQVLDLLQFVPLRRNGAQLRGACPVRQCNSPDRRFSANIARNQFRCFTCGVQGSQLELWAAATDQTVYQAALDLCHRLGIEVPWIRRCEDGSSLRRNRKRRGNVLV